MAFLAGVFQKIINAFNGAILRLDARTVPDGNALLSANCAYTLGAQVGTRFGHQLVALDLSNGSITSMYNWVFTNPNSGSPLQISMLVYFSLSSASLLGFEIYPAPGFTGAIVTGMNTARGVVLVGTGLRLYIAYYDNTAKLGAEPAQVYGFGVGVDNLFAAPLLTIPTISETGAGVCTAGVHNIGYVFTTRNGYTGKLNPVFSNGTFRPIPFTSTGGKNIQVVIAATLPTYLGSPATYQIVMSTVANPNRYFAVPGAVASCANPTTISFSIDDADLAATGADFTAYQNLLTSNVAGTPPFLPVAIFTYSSRMCYVTIDSSGFPVTYISEPNNYQYITADQHGIYLEGNAQSVQGFSLRGVCYLATQSSLFSCEDNGDVPVNWTPPQKVDGSIGILAPTCVTVNPSLGYAAIASDRGLYIFQGGIFPALPLSYYQQPDWGRINWRLPSQVQVVDDQLNKRFVVIAPLNTTIAAFTNVSGNTFDITTVQNPHLYPQAVKIGVGGAFGMVSVTGPNTFRVTFGSSPTISVGAIIFAQDTSHQMTWDYTQGDTPQTVMYSLNSMGSTAQGFTGYTPGAVAVVQNQPASLQEVWYGLLNANTGNICPFLRQCDGSEVAPYQDLDTSGLNPLPINWIYETNLIPGIDDESGTLHTFCGMHFRAVGNGTISLVVNSMDGAKTLVPLASPLTISQTPGIDYLVKWNLNNTEQESIEFQTNTVGVYAILSLVKAYYAPVATQR